MKNLIEVKADIHIDGDVYIEHKNQMHYIGTLGEPFISEIPNRCFLKAKKILKLK